ncbi:hypothetical protein KZ820_14490 [Sphingomonas sp. RRHST34]|uniref:Uncharacterized protein n=1 Tax=Sphingomonas citri TaxID=2862499 RepID=A0ABS7BQS3_9SPHN|nr:hypothetical protein [Sphingomonas citri]MBW6531947.1 hypothetical protein [Sphingomonas citri]
MSRQPPELTRDRLLRDLMATVDAGMAKIVPMDAEPGANAVSVTVSFGGKRKRLRDPSY